MPMTFATSGNYMGSQVPMARTTNADLLGNHLNLDQADKLRLRRYREHWSFYAGQHWNFKREDGDPLVTLNYFKKIIDKSASFLVSQDFAITVPDPLTDVTVPFLTEVWKYNKARKKLWDMALTGAVTGDVFLLVMYREPTELQRRQHPYSQGKIWINLIPSESVFPVYDPMDKEVITSVRIETMYYDTTPQNSIFNGVGRDIDKSQKLKRFTMIITPDTIVEKYSDRPPVEKPNALREIPMVHIKNLPNPGEPYGIPDGLEIVDINRLINEKATDLSDFVNYDAHPTTCIIGAKADSLERGPGQLWSGFPAGTQIQTLNNPGDLGAAKSFLDMAKSMLMELSDTPEGSLGKNQPISNTSGVALHMQYAPLMEKTKKKRAQYEAGIEEVNRLVLRVGQIMGQIELPFDLDKKSGGKIAQVLRDTDDGQVREKKAYRIDPASMDFIDPVDVRLNHVRHYSFGKEVREDPYWKILSEHRKVSKSFWDPTPEQTLDEHQKDQAAATPQPEPVEGEGPQPGVGGGPVIPQLPHEAIDIPPEPEWVDIVVPFHDPVSGELLREETQNKFLVPTGTMKPQYIDPYETEVKFNDPLPKDVHLLAQLYMQYLQMGVVSRRWVQQNIPDIAPHIDDIEKDLERDKSSGMMPGGGMPPATEMQGEEQQREAASMTPPSSPTAGEAE